jgi:amino acid adenylation domain-containing protein
VRLDSFLDASAGRTPDKVAIVFGERRLTYAHIDQAANRLAWALREGGVARGDRVAVYLDNSPEAVISIFGVLKADAVFMMVNPTTKSEKLLTLLNDARPTVVITDGRRLPTVLRVRESATSVTMVLVSGSESDRDDEALEAAPGVLALDAIIQRTDGSTAPARYAIDIDLASLIYTSGSTGRPKGVMLTHRNMVTASTSITTYLENRSSDIVLNVLPLSFDYGLYQVLMAFQFGGTVVLERSFTYPHAVLETLAREQVTGFPVVPTIAALLLQMDLTCYDFSSVRYVTNTAAALPVAHLSELRKQFPGAKIFSMYGLTECKRVTFLPPEQLDRRPSSVGRGMPNQEVYLIDAEGKRLRSGVGELVIRGSHVMQGYWEQPEDTARVLKPGPIGNECVLHTGDLFRMDEEGYLYFISRMDDIIKTRGEKVSPREVEDVLHRLEGVAEAAVTGLPHAILGQAIKATVVPKRGALLSEHDVLRHCGQYLEDFRVPHMVEFRDALPKTANGKADRAALIKAAETLANPSLQATH